jgi:hypothetical protein
VAVDIEYTLCRMELFKNSTPDMLFHLTRSDLRLSEQWLRIDHTNTANGRHCLVYISGLCLDWRRIGERWKCHATTMQRGVVDSCQNRYHRATLVSCS